MSRRVVLMAIAVIATSTSLVWGQAVARSGAAASAVVGGGAVPGAGAIRASDDEIVSLLADGTSRSETLKGLSDRLSKSDVIVYLRPDITAKGRSDTTGRLTFLSARGGYRYVVIHVPSGQPRQQQLAILGHELQQAVMIADAPSVVDVQTLRAEFERVGTVMQATGGAGAVSFDSPAAADVKRRVLREIAR